MADDMVMRSVYLRPTEDTQLRQLAHELNVTKSDLIRSAISVKLREWLESDEEELIMKDLTFGRRESALPRTALVEKTDHQPEKKDQDTSLDPVKEARVSDRRKDNRSANRSQSRIKPNKVNKPSARMVRAQVEA